jgi:hypothetical protein
VLHLPTPTARWVNATGLWKYLVVERLTASSAQSSSVLSQGVEGTWLQGLAG